MTNPAPRPFLRLPGVTHHEYGIDTTELLLDREDVAALLGVPATTVDNLHRMRQLPAVRVGKHNRWKPGAVRDFIASLEPGRD